MVIPPGILLPVKLKEFLPWHSPLACVPVFLTGSVEVGVLEIFASLIKLNLICLNTAGFMFYKVIFSIKLKILVGSTVIVLHCHTVSLSDWQLFLYILIIKKMSRKCNL